MSADRSCYLDSAANLPTPRAPAGSPVGALRQEPATPGSGSALTHGAAQSSSPLRKMRALGNWLLAPPAFTLAPELAERPTAWPLPPTRYTR